MAKGYQNALCVLKPDRIEALSLEPEALRLWQHWGKVRVEKPRSLHFTHPLFPEIDLFKLQKIGR
jgi:hypothetical protein